MSRTIVQKVVFKNTAARSLYELYMDSAKHSLIAGGPAKISKKEDIFTISLKGFRIPPND